jgi:hypothetical protein
LLTFIQTPHQRQQHNLQEGQLQQQLVMAAMYNQKQNQHQWQLLMLVMLSSSSGSSTSSSNQGLK